MKLSKAKIEKTIKSKRKKEGSYGSYTKISRWYGVKIIKIKKTDNSLNSFLKEVALLMIASHSKISPIIKDFFIVNYDTERFGVIVMQDLGEKINDVHLKKVDFLKMIKERFLDKTGLIHRDLHCGNILSKRRKTKEIKNLKVIDFTPQYIGVHKELKEEFNLLINELREITKV